MQKFHMHHFKMISRKWILYIAFSDTNSIYFRWKVIDLRLLKKKNRTKEERSITIITSVLHLDHLNGAKSKHIFIHKAMATKRIQYRKIGVFSWRHENWACFTKWMLLEVYWVIPALCSRMLRTYSSDLNLMVRQQCNAMLSLKKKETQVEKKQLNGRFALWLSRTNIFSGFIISFFPSLFIIYLVNFSQFYVWTALQSQKYSRKRTNRYINCFIVVSFPPNVTSKNACSSRPDKIHSWWFF